MAKKFLPYVLFVFLFVVFLIGYFQKDKLNDFISEKIKAETSDKVSLSVEELVQNSYNYSKNGERYDFTLLEFGTGTCAVCKQMEPVLDEIRKSKSEKIKVVFIHTMNPENQDLIKYFGISTIPMQVLLDRNGKTFYKNYGFISAENIILKAQQNNSN